MYLADYQIILYTSAFLGNIKSSTKEPYDEMLAQVNKWLDKVYPTRSTNFADITTVIETMDNLSKTFCSNLTLTVSSADQVVSSVRICCILILNCSFIVYNLVQLMLTMMQNYFK